RVRVGSYPSSSATRSNFRPSIPPASLTRPSAVSTPSFICRPSSLDGPVRAVLMPSVTRAGAAGLGGAGGGAADGRNVKEAAAARSGAPTAGADQTARLPRGAERGLESAGGRITGPGWGGAEALGRAAAAAGAAVGRGLEGGGGAPAARSTGFSAVGGGGV